MTSKYEVFKAALKQIPLGAIIIDDNDKVIFVNKAAENINKISPKKILGKNIISCHPKKYRDKIRLTLNSLKNDKVNSLTQIINGKDDNKTFEVTCTSIKDDNDNYLGLIKLTKDITKQRRNESNKTKSLKKLETQVSKLTEQLQDLFISFMTSLVKTLEAKDSYTKGHSLRVGDIATKIAEHTYQSPSKVENIKLAGQLHDIGKIGIQETLLNKPGKLTEKEFNYIKQHPIISENILTPVNKFNTITNIVRHHHERFDGKGYPDKLHGDKIPSGAKIIAIADSYDAMTSDRPYRAAMDPEIAAKEIEDNLGTQFDPAFGEKFLDLFYAGSFA